MSIWFVAAVVVGVSFGLNKEKKRVLKEHGAEKEEGKNMNQWIFLGVSQFVDAKNEFVTCHA